jgi:hypothetical protein
LGIILVVTHFWVPTKKNENTKYKKNIYKKILKGNPKNNKSEKRMLEC